MSLNVNYTSLYQNGIDNSMLKEVSREILDRAAAKNNNYNNSYYAPTQVNSVAKPVELGLDLYQGRLDISVQKQIAINNSLQFQFNSQTLQSIQFLNSQAAIAGRVDGKYVPTTVNAPTETQKFAETNKSQFSEILTTEISKDKHGSNPFYNGELLLNNSSSKKEENEVKQHENNKLNSIFI